MEKQRGVSSLKALCLVAAERGLGLGARQVQASPKLRKVWPSTKFFIAACRAATEVGIPTIAHLNNLSIRTKNAFSQASFNVIA